MVIKVNIERLLCAVAFASWLLLSHAGSAAAGDDGSLTVPLKTGQPVKLDLSASADRDQIDYSELLQVFVGNDADWHADKAPIAGRYRADDRTISFSPMFDFLTGQDYVVRVRHPGTANEVSYKLTSFNIPSATPVVNPAITDIFPSGDVLPENVLRFYIHFSTPMKPHVAFEYIKLIDASGKVDDAAFMRFKQELWSEDRKRLTLLMDPGRIKRSVNTNLKLGPALKKGERYQLVVDGGWPTANGAKPLARFSKSFLVFGCFKELPNADNWEITAPKIRKKTPLKIKFDRPFDHQLLQKYIKVFSATGKEIKGNVSIGNHETQWRFQPYEPWVDERVTIVVDSELEDVACNNFQDLLDHSIKTETKDIPSISIAVDLKF